MFEIIYKILLVIIIVSFIAAIIALIAGILFNHPLAVLKDNRRACNAEFQKLYSKIIHCPTPADMAVLEGEIFNFYDDYKLCDNCTDLTSRLHAAKDNRLTKLSPVKFRL